MRKNDRVRFSRPFLTRAACVALTGALALVCAGCGGSAADETGGVATTTAANATTTALVSTTATSASTTVATTTATATEAAAAAAITTVAPAATTTAPAAPVTARQPQTPAPLTEAQQDAIRQAYRDDLRTRYPDDESVQNLTLDDMGLRQIATYGDCVVLFVDVPCFAHADKLEDVAYEGVTFHFASSQRPVVYRAGAIMTFQKAFEGGWLTRDDLADLALHFPKV